MSFIIIANTFGSCGFKLKRGEENQRDAATVVAGCQAMKRLLAPILQSQSHKLILRCPFNKDLDKRMKRDKS